MVTSKNIEPIDNRAVLIFLHYFGGSKKSWQWVIEDLKEDFQCLAINLPGFGGYKALKNPSIQNMAAYVQKEIKSYAIGEYTLIGHSMGAKIALQIAINDTNQTVQQLILVAPSPPGIEPIEEDEKKRMLHHPNLKEAKTTVKNITQLDLSEEKYDLAVETNLIADKETWNWWLNKGMNHSIADQAENLKLPITILNSEDDPVMTPEIIRERVMNVLTEAELVTTKSTGHLMPMENPNWVAEQIRSVLSK